MSDKQLYYAVTRVHTNELNLVTGQDLQQLLDAATLQDALSILQSKGWGDPTLDFGDVEGLLSLETQKIWSLMGEIVGDVPAFDVFRYSHDINNIKAAIKLHYTGQKIDDDEKKRYFMPFGTVPTSDVIKRVEEKDFSHLPEPWDKAAAEAYDAITQTGNGQNCDIIIDRVGLELIYQSGVSSKNPLLKEYAEITVDFANIKTALRSAKSGRGRDFLEHALADAGSIEIKYLIQAALDGEQRVIEFVSSTKYKDAADSLAKSIPAFEQWGSNYLMQQIRPQRYAIEGLEPLAAFILARENEIAMVRLVLSAKSNNLDHDKIKERVREMYV